MQVFPFMFFTDQDARYMIGRMSRVRASRIGIGHLFRIAMVGDDQELAMDGLQGFDDLAAAGIARCLLYTSPSPRDGLLSRMPSSA